MTIKRLDHVSVVVEDLAAAVDFFVALGMTKDADRGWARPAGADEVSTSKTGRDRTGECTAERPGLRIVMFAVENVDDMVARLRAQGGELNGEEAQYEDKYRLC
jgi:catechol 2,3-dioxygenase-like lactoylglutathione lyase family enzyme